MSRHDCRGVDFFAQPRAVSREWVRWHEVSRDVPSVRISLQSRIIVSFFSLSVHSPNVVSIYPPAVCTHPLPSQRLSRHQWTLTQRTEHRHSSLKQRTHFRCLCISWPSFAYILPLSACTHPLGHSALTHLSHTAHSLPLVCAFPLLNSALTHVQFALNLPHTTLNSHPLSAHKSSLPHWHSSLTQLTHTTHSYNRLWQDHLR